MRSITLAVGNCEDLELTESEKRKIREAQISASGHISSALGEARKEQERDSEDRNGN